MTQPVNLFLTTKRQQSKEMILQSQMTRFPTGASLPTRRFLALFCCSPIHGQLTSHTKSPTRSSFDKADTDARRDTAKQGNRQHLRRLPGLLRVRTTGKQDTICNILDWHSSRISAPSRRDSDWSHIRSRLRPASDCRRDVSRCFRHDDDESRQGILGSSVGARNLRRSGRGLLVLTECRHHGHVFQLQACFHDWNYQCRGFYWY